MKKTSTIIFLLFCLRLGSFAQEIKQRTTNQGVTSKEEKVLLAKGRDKYADGNYKEAQTIFLKLLKIDSSSLTYNFELGTAYFDSPFEKLKALRYFQKALNYTKEDTLGELFYFLARSYHLNNQFEAALINYKRYFSLIQKSGTERSDKGETDIKSEVKRQIEMCEYAQELVSRPINVVITPLSSSINFRDCPEYAPVISADESIIVFTSRRKESTGGKTDDRGQYYEDIYLAKASPKNANIKIPQFEKAVQLDAPTNTSSHDAALSLSSDGKQLFSYRNENIYVSKLIGTKWAKPVKLNENINPGGSRQSSLCLSADGNTVYFASDREGGFGGVDIYKSEKVFKTDSPGEGDWGPAQNLGSVVNTPYDEDSPFMHPDGRTLFFASNGHRTMGGFDIFKSSLAYDKTWSEPENLGYPINTTGDDVHFVVNAKGDHAYFASVREREGKLGSMDIYILLMEPKNIPVTQMKGIVKSGAGLTPTSAIVHVYDKETGKEIYTTTTNSATGEYLLILPAGKKYSVSIAAEGFKPYTQDIFVRDQKDFHEEFKEINVAAMDPEQRFEKEIINIPFLDLDNSIASDSVRLNDLISQLTKYLVRSKLIIYIYKDNLIAAISGKNVDLKKEAPTRPIEVKNNAVVKNEKPLETQKTSDNAGLENKKNQAVEIQKVVKTASLANIPTINPMLFDFNKFDFMSDGTSEMDKVVAYFKSNSSAKAMIVGHTDGIGSDSYNLILSGKRAESVSNYLISAGINKNKIRTKQMGKKMPYAPNENSDKSDNPEGRKLNRRVEIKISEEN